MEASGCDSGGGRGVSAARCGAERTRKKQTSKKTDTQEPPLTHSQQTLDFKFNRFVAALHWL